MPERPERPKLAVFSTKPYDRAFLDAANANLAAGGGGGPVFEPRYLEPTLNAATAALAAGCPAVCGFVHDHFDAETLRLLAAGGVKLVALRCAGFNNVDLAAAARLGVTIVRVPAYSPHAVAEHTVALILALDRKIHRAWNRVREGNFELAGLMGREIHGRAVGIVGTGEIGAVVAKILAGFDAKLLAYDPRENPAVTAAGGRYVSLETLLGEAEIVTLHCPLTPATRHLIRKDRLALMRDGALLVNTGRGALIDAREVVDALKSGKLGGVALDVYEEEEGLFGRDHSGDIIADDVFARLLTFPNVVITGHQAYFTEPALRAIAETTVDNVRRWAAGEPPLREVPADVETPSSVNALSPK
jgi:D-lactate dehydrogenase